MVEKDGSSEVDGTDMSIDSHRNIGFFASLTSAFCVIKAGNFNVTGNYHVSSPRGARPDN